MRHVASRLVEARYNRVHQNSEYASGYYSLSPPPGTPPRTPPPGTSSASSPASPASGASGTSPATCWQQPHGEEEEEEENEENEDGRRTEEEGRAVFTHSFEPHASEVIALFRRLQPGVRWQVLQVRSITILDYKVNLLNHCFVPIIALFLILKCFYSSFRPRSFFPSVIHRIDSVQHVGQTRTHRICPRLH